MSGSQTDAFYYRSEGEEVGPVPAAKLIELFETHMITAYDEVRRGRDGDWEPAQTVVSDLLISRKRPASVSAPAAATGGSASAEPRHAPRPEENSLLAQRGAPSPKAAKGISDEEIAAQIADAKARVQRASTVRSIVVMGLAAVAAGYSYWSSAYLGGAPSIVDRPLRVDMTIEMVGASVDVEGRGGRHKGTGDLTLSRVRNVNHTSDGPVAVEYEEDLVRWRADLQGTASHEDQLPGSLRGETIEFDGAGSSATASLSTGEASAKQAARLAAMRFDSSALYPDQRLFPWSRSTWVVKAPEACTVLGLEMSACDAEVNVTFKGLGSCSFERCARLAIQGEWTGVTDGHEMRLMLEGEILRSLKRGIDLSIDGTGTLRIGLQLAGLQGAVGKATLSGPVTYRQTTTSAE